MRPRARARTRATERWRPRRGDAAAMNRLRQHLTRTHARTMTQRLHSQQQPPPSKIRSTVRRSPTAERRERSASPRPRAHSSRRRRQESAKGRGTDRRARAHANAARACRCCPCCYPCCYLHCCCLHCCPSGQSRGQSNPTRQRTQSKRPKRGRATWAAIEGSETWMRRPMAAAEWAESVEIETSHCHCCLCCCAIETDEGQNSDCRRCQTCYRRRHSEARIVPHTNGTMSDWRPSILQHYCRRRRLQRNSPFRPMRDTRLRQRRRPSRRCANQ